MQSEKISALGNLIAGIAHEINYPVGFIHSNLAHAESCFQDLLQVIEVYQQECLPTSAIATVIDAVDLDHLREDLPKLMRSMQHGIERIRDISISLRTFDTGGEIPILDKSSISPYKANI